MCSLMWFRKKTPTPHFKMHCRRASGIGSLEETPPRAVAQMREAFRALREFLTLEESSHLIKHKSK